MRRSIKILTFTVAIIIAVCGFSYLTDKAIYTSWKLTNNSDDKTKISWAKFEWSGATLNGKYDDKVAMQIPCKIEGLPNVFTFQFDLGTGLTGVYENSFSSFYSLNPTVENKIQKLRSPLQFWNQYKCFKDFIITFGNYIATNKVAFIYKNYGGEILNPDFTDTFHIGTIGRDLFKDKILIIDYPDKQFAICDEMPKQFASNLFNIELGKNGEIILPMKIHGKSYRIMFDNGSSMFPLITEETNISKFSSSSYVDTIEIPSWGKKHSVMGKMITDTFTLAGQRFSDVEVYGETFLPIHKIADGIAGNYLFWNKTIIIDFKNKKFGIQ